MSRRAVILSLALSFLVGSLLLVQQHTYYLSPALQPEALEIKQLDALCQADDPFEIEYGRTNIRMTRAYEGRLLAVIHADIRFSSPLRAIYTKSTRGSRGHDINHWR